MSGELTQLVPDPALWRLFSERERAVFAGLCEGLPDKAIAHRIGLARRTVINYVQSISHKVRLTHPLRHHTRGELVAIVCHIEAPQYKVTFPVEHSERAA